MAMSWLATACASLAATPRMTTRGAVVVAVVFIIFGPLGLFWDVVVGLGLVVEGCEQLAVADLGEAL